MVLIDDQAGFQTGADGRETGFGGADPKGIRLWSRLCFAGCLAWASGADAAPDVVVPADAPIEMTADGGLTIDFDRQTGRAEGNVVIRRTDMIVCCDRADARFNRGRIAQVRCEGDVVINRVDGTRITAEALQFEAVHHRLVLTGRVVAQRPDGQLTGARMVYRLDKDELQVSGPGSTLRLRPPPSGSVQTRPGPRGSARRGQDRKATGTGSTVSASVRRCPTPKGAR